MYLENFLLGRVKLLALYSYIIFAGDCVLVFFFFFFKICHDIPKIKEKGAEKYLG